VPLVSQQLVGRDEFLAEIRDQLEQAQQCYKSAYNRKHRKREFGVGDWVWLRLLHSLVASLDIKGKEKLGPKVLQTIQDNRAGEHRSIQIGNAAGCQAP
jgi:hypothetical protein